MVAKQTALRWHGWYMSGPYRVLDVADHFKVTPRTVRAAFKDYNLPRKPRGVNRRAAQFNPIRDEAKRRYEAGERAEHIAADLGINPQTIHNWRWRYGWRYQRLLTEDQKAAVLHRIRMGEHHIAVAVDIGLHPATTRAYARQLRTGEVQAPLLRPIVRTARAGRNLRPEPISPLAGWWCSSCTWRGSSADEWKKHKTTRHQ